MTSKPSSSLVLGTPERAEVTSETSIHVAQPHDEPSWSQYVASHPASTLGHHFGWKAVIEKTYGHRTYYLCSKDKDRINGILPLAHMKGWLTGNRLVSLPFLDCAGILSNSEDASNALLAEAITLARRVGASGVDLRHLTADTSQDPESGRSTLVLPLKATQDELWKALDSKVRNQIRKAEKSGLRTIVADASRLDEFYKVFCINMRDLGSPVHSRSLFINVLDTFRESSRLYLTLDSSENVIGGAISLTQGQLCSVPWASSLRETFKWCPNHSLYWKILSDCVERGISLFDFGRSHVGSGTYKFKTQWDAVPRNLDWVAYMPDGAKVAQHLLKPSDQRIVTRVWSGLPLPVANFLGPKIRGRLSN